MSDFDIQKNWDDIKLKIQDEFDLLPVSYKTWIEPLQYYKTENNVVYIIEPTDIRNRLDYISKNFSDYFKVVISELMGQEISVQFVQDKDVSDLAEKKAEPGSSKVTSLAEAAGLNPRYNFDTFVVGNNNRFAHSACLAVAEQPGEVYNPLYIYGEPGLGKTHLMHSIGHFILEQDPEKKVLYVTSEDFLNEVIDSIRGGSAGNASSMAKLRDKYRTVDVLLIDDIQTIIGKESTQEEFFHTFNALHEAHKQIVLSSDRPPKEIQTLDERFRSRFSWGLTADIQAPNYETRMAILKKNAEAINLDISDEIMEYIANNITTNIRELEGALHKIVHFSKLQPNSPFNLEFAQEALKDIIYTTKSSNMTYEGVMKIVSEEFHVKQEEIVSAKRNQEFVLPRQIVMYLLDDILHMSYSQIGKKMGRDHTTVMHGKEKIVEELNVNEELRQRVEIIRKKITG